MPHYEENHIIEDTILNNKDERYFSLSSKISYLTQLGLSLYSAAGVLTENITEATLTGTSAILSTIATPTAKYFVKKAKQKLFKKPENKNSLEDYLNSS